MNDQLGSFVAAASSFVEGAYNQVVSALTASTDSAHDVLANLESKVTDYIDLPVNWGEGITDVLDQIDRSWLDDAIEKTKDIYNGVKDAIDGYIDNITGNTGKVADKSEAQIRQELDDATNKLKGDIPKVPEEPVTPKPPEPTPSVPAVYEPPASMLDAIKAIPSTLAGISSAVSLFGKIADVSEIMHSPEDALAQLRKSIDSDPWFHDLQQWTPSVAIGAGIGALVGAPLGFLPMIMDCYSKGMGESIGNIARSLWHPARIQITELIMAYLRGHIDQEKLLTDGESLGFAPEDIMVYLKLTRQMLTTGDLLTLWLRKEIDDVTLDKYLGDLLIAKPDIARLKALTQLIPSPADLVHMAVREAFTPEIAEAFGQYQDYPEVATEWFEKQGLSEEWARRFWAAHWELPSIQMAFEMFQRKVISQDDLNLLLRALDVMPYWREKLTQIAYQPITRVDIRRIHKMHLITDDELQLRYEAIGYSPEDAVMLVKFTIELNKEEEKLEKAAERDLTASEILSSYANVLIDRNDTSTLLQGLGYDQNEIELKLTLAELPGIKRIRNKQIEIIKQRLFYDVIDSNGAVDELNKLDLPPFEMEYQLLDIQLDLELAGIKDAAAAKKAAEAKAKADAAAAAKKVK